MNKKRIISLLLCLTVRLIQFDDFIDQRQFLILKLFTDVFAHFFRIIAQKGNVQHVPCLLNFFGGRKKSFRPLSGARSSRGTTQFVCLADLICAVWGTPRRFVICFLREGNSAGIPCLAPPGKSLKKAWTEPFPSQEMYRGIIQPYDGHCKRVFQRNFPSCLPFGSEKQPAVRPAGCQRGNP